MQLMVLFTMLVPYLTMLSLIRKFSCCVNGYEEAGDTIHEVDVWYISKDNLFVPKHVGSYEDISFLLEKNAKEFVEKLDSLALTIRRT